jgi:hypothetical protein
MAKTSNIHDMDSYRQRNDEQRQREAVSDAMLTVARELRRLEKVTDGKHDNGGGDRAGWQPTEGSINDRHAGSPTRRAQHRGDRTGGAGRSPGQDLGKVAGGKGHWSSTTIPIMLRPVLIDLNRHLQPPNPAPAPPPRDKPPKTSPPPKTLEEKRRQEERWRWTAKELGEAIRGGL